MMYSRVLGLLVGLVAFAPLCTAGILTVGPAGSGAQFTEIQAAVDAALDDDVILVRPGTYQAFSVGKPLRILGDGTGTVHVNGSATVGLVVHDIAAGKELVLSALEIRNTAWPALLVVQDCPGTVALSALDLQDTGSARVGLQVDACARVLLLDSRVTAGYQQHAVGGVVRGAVVAQGSELWVANTDVLGTTIEGDLVDHASPGIEVTHSTLHVSRSRIHGGEVFYSSAWADTYPGGAGIKASGSSLDLFGGPTAAILGGHGCHELLGTGTSGGPGVELLQGSNAKISQNETIQGGLDGRALFRAPEIRADAASSFTLPPRIFPTLQSSALQVTTGSSFTLTLEGNPGGHDVLYAALRTGPTQSFPGVRGLALLDPLQTFLITSAILPASGAATVGVDIPPLPALLGATLFFQSAESFSAQRSIANPVLVTITG